MGIFKPQRTIQLPTKDILSWIFDDPHHDKDEPVYIHPRYEGETCQLMSLRFILTPKTLRERYLQIKLA
jgi:hypothetical protein